MKKFVEYLVVLILRGALRVILEGGGGVNIPKSKFKGSLCMVLSTFWKLLGEGPRPSVPLSASVVPAREVCCTAEFFWPSTFGVKGQTHEL